MLKHLKTFKQQFFLSAKGLTPISPLVYARITSTHNVNNSGYSLSALDTSHCLFHLGCQ